MAKAVRVAVTGGAGQIGYALVFRMAAGEMLGAETPVELRLLEIEPALPALKGVVMELQDGAFPLLQSVVTTADPREAFEGADWALLIGSVPRKAGMERADLLNINGKIFVEQGRALNEVAAEACRVLVVGNPCNTNALIAQSQMTRLNPQQVYAMTMLDQNRAVAQLAERAGVGPADVRRCAVWGNHSPTMFPDFYHAEIQGRPATEVISDEKWFKTTFLETVQKRGAAVIQARGASSAASAANAVIETVRRVSRPTPEGDWFSLALSSQGQYGIEEGLVFSFPVRSDGRQCVVVEGIDHNEYAQEKLAVTEAELKKEKETVAEWLNAG